MIAARFRSCGGVLCGLQISGHADFGDAGYDIVCASVSSAVQLTANTITEIFRVPAKVEALDNEIRISIRQQDDSTGAGSKLLAGLQLQLQCLSEDYPNRIQMKLTEV